MKNFLIIAGCVITGIAIISCNKTRRNTGRAYMPDMNYSVAYETYAPAEERLAKYGAHYNNRPVDGTIAREDLFSYTLKNDSAGYGASVNVKNPLPPLNAEKFLEAARLYLINCAICHGAKLDGNGPLYNGGNGPFSAPPRNFLTDPVVLDMPEGRMFHSITYGRLQMGSYGAQLNSEQRWMIIHYIKEKQVAAAGSAPKTGADSTNTVAKKQAGDSIATGK